MCLGTAYTPPEICSQPKGRGYRVETSADVWAFGVVLFCIMTGSFPWNLADPDTDPLFLEFKAWQSRQTPAVPVHWARFTPDILRLFRRMLECEPRRRTAVGTLFNHTDQAWIVCAERRAPAPPTRQPNGGGTVRRRGEGSNAQCREGGTRSNAHCRSAYFDKVDEATVAPSPRHCAIDTAAADRKSRVDRVNSWLLGQISSSISMT